VNGVWLYFDVEGCGLAVRDAGMAAKPTLVLLHGGPGADHSLFKPEFSAMAGEAQVVYLDQRGSGRSDRGDPDTWTWDQWADDGVGHGVFRQAPSQAFAVLRHFLPQSPANPAADALAAVHQGAPKGG
jgi:predicted esterase